MTANKEWVDLRNHLSQSLNLHRAGIHGHSEVDDDYFTALRYVVGKMDETLELVNRGNWPTELDIVELYDRACGGSHSCEISEDTFKEVIYEALSRWGSNKNTRPEVAEEAAKDVSQVSDGYHTFADLYEHRHALCLAFMKAMPQRWWFSKRHSDGELCFGDGEWFIVGAELPGMGKHGSITYHLPIRLWNVAKETGASELVKGRPWDGHTADEVVSRLVKWASVESPVGKGPSDDQIRATILDSLNSFPPSHPDAKKLSATDYERELEMVKARAVLSRWGHIMPQPLSWVSEDELAKVIYEEAMRGCSNEMNWPKWEDLPVSLARDCAFDAARSVMALFGKSPSLHQSKGSLIKEVNIAMNTASWVDGPSAAIKAMARWLREESQGHLGNGEYWANRMESEAQR
jgi:hypothetical protein